MAYYSIEEYLSLPIPELAEVSTPEEDAASVGQFLSFMMPLVSVTMVRFEQGRCDAGDWSPTDSAAEAAGVAACIRRGGVDGLLPYLDADGIAVGEGLDRYLELKPGLHAVACALYYAKCLSGYLVVCRRDNWEDIQLQLLRVTRERMSVAYVRRLSLESVSRTSFVFNTMMDSIKASVYVTELETNRILFMNQSMREAFGLENPEGKTCFEVLQQGMGRRCPFCPVEQLLRAGLNAPAVQWDEVNTKTGRFYHNYDSLIRWVDGTVVHLQQSIDVTELKEANTDELTHLMNRRTGKEALEATLRQALEEERTVTVAYCDINQLKMVNDLFGHAQGDHLITATASAMQEFLREGEYAFRLSGDEFVVLYRSGEKYARQRLTATQEKLRAVDERYHAGFCFGLVEVTPDRAVSVEDVLLLADERMYEQKRRLHITRNADRLKLTHQGRTADSFRYDKEYLYDALCASSDDYPFICNMKTGAFRYAPAMVEEFDLPAEVIENAAAVWGARVHEEDKAAFLEANQAISDGREMTHCVEYRAMDRRGQWVWVRCRGQVELDENGERSIFAGFISRLGMHNRVDYLTGLFNKLEFEESIRRHIEKAPDISLGVIVLGLDDLKHVNDLYDRAFGDEVIRITGSRLRALLPEGAEVYRLDGDEFGVVLCGTDEAELRAICHTVTYGFEGQQELDGRKYHCTLSGGSVLYPKDADNYLELVKFGSYCLGYAKRHGKNCCIAYSPGILDNRARGLEMVEDLRSSVKNGFEGFSLRFQPLVEAATGRLMGAEALLRWESANFGPVSPVEFIPLLEQTGMIIPVGKWVLGTAVSRCTPWLQYRSDFVLNVNLSYLQIQGAELVPLVLRVLEEYSFPSQNLVLELTESYFVQDNRHVQDIFMQLRQQGVRTAVDDFGTGFSTLSILKNIPADEVKIDRTFIRDIRTSSFDLTFIRFVVELCHDVGIVVCLEGVETAEEYEIVKDMGLDMLQGFLFARPLPGDEFEQKYFAR